MREIIVWVFELVSSFRLHLLIISIVGMIVSAILFSSLYLALIFLAIFLYALFPLRSWKVWQTNTGGNADKSYSICSFNIEWNASEHVKSLEYIKNSLADILVLQEVPESLTGEIEQYRSEFPYQYGEGHSYVMVLSKHELEFVGYLPWPGKFHHRALHVRLNLNGDKINIFAIHLQVTRSWKEVSMQNQQLIALFDNLRKVDGPVLLVGDFNAGTASNVLRRVESNTGFYCCENLLTYKRTWPSNAGLLGIQLDHIYCNEKISLSNLELGPVLDSDHRPVCCEFSVYDASARSS